MRANCWYGKKDVRVEEVPDPKILNSNDIIVKVTSTAICGSDLHLYDGVMPTMEKGDILGHEFMGEVIETGPTVTKLKKGDRVVVPFPIACGHCFSCERELYSCCENSNPNAHIAEAALGHSAAGLFGYSHMTGGFAGGQAEYARVPFADVGPIKIPDELTDEQVLFLSDILPTGYMAAENCNIQPGDTVVVWGCGPVGQFAIESAYLLGAERVIAIDRFPGRLAMAHDKAKAEIVNYEEVDSLLDTIKEMTGGRGPDSCIDAVGMEAHYPGISGIGDTIKQKLKMEADKPYVFREAVMSVRNGGTVSVAGVYGGLDDKIPMGAIMNRAITIKSGQTPVQKYLPMLLEKIRKGEINSTFVITHRLGLEDAAAGYKMFNEQKDECIKVVLKPHGGAATNGAAAN